MESELIETWPTVKTECVDSCPICNSRAVSMQTNRLVDWQSHPPSGFWLMNICGHCGSGYLAMRPTEEYIHEAYKNYYTHTDKKDKIINSTLRRVQQYLYSEFCSFAHKKYSLFNWLIYFGARLIYPIGLYFDAKSRNIAKIKNKGRLLDVGCGNGEFLELARRYGWEVSGVDFDLEAVTTARAKGLDIKHGGIEAVDKNERFDFISLSHVIEHVYDPAGFLKYCADLLTRNGVLWLETPNMESIGFRVYKSNWRGLEPPRHIVLFSKKALIKTLHNAGLKSVKQKCHFLSGVYTALYSEKLLDKTNLRRSPISKFIRPIEAIMRIVYVESMQFLSSRKREFLTIIATK